MLKIIIIFILIGLLGLIVLGLIINIIRLNLKGEQVNYLKQIGLIVSLMFVGGMLGIYNMYNIATTAYDNREEILETASEVISSTVEFGATAVFEGIGRTIDHFQENWDEDYVEQLKNVDVEILDIRRDSIDERNDKVYLDLKFINNNAENDRLNIGHISDNNYILIADADELYYPLKSTTSQYNQFVAVGETVIKFEGIIPNTMKVKYFRLLDERKEVSEGN